MEAIKEVYIFCCYAHQKQNLYNLKKIGDTLNP